MCWSNLPVSKNIDGISIVPALTGRRQRSHDFLYWEFHEQGGKQAVRVQDWKGIKLDVSVRLDSPIELYNLKHDPGEKTNLASEYPEIVRRIAQIMKESHKRDPEWPLLSSEKNF